MVMQHYRWDFIGLSTDEKPTKSNSEKVTDGSTYYCSDNSKLYVWYKDQWYEKTVSGGGTYELPIASAETLGGVKIGNNLTINSETGVLDAQDTTYTAGTGITISADNEISATGGGSVTPVQTTGTSTTDVMSQNATSRLVFAPLRDTTTYLANDTISIGSDMTWTNAHNISVGAVTHQGTSTGDQYSIFISPRGGVSGNSKRGRIFIGTTESGNNKAFESQTVSIGTEALASGLGAIALGAFSTASTKGEMNIGVDSGHTGYGYNNTQYRKISGVHDGIDLHDCATVAQGNTLGHGAPTTATVGVIGQLYTDIDASPIHTYQLTAIEVDVVAGTASYTWTQRW